MQEGFAGLWFSSVLQLSLRGHINPEAARETSEATEDEIRVEVMPVFEVIPVSFFKDHTVCSSHPGLSIFCLFYLCECL